MGSNEYLPTWAHLREALDEIPIAVKATRRTRHLTVHEAAAEAGMDGSTLWRVEHGDQYTRDTLRKVLAWLDASSTTDNGSDHAQHP